MFPSVFSFRSALRHNLSLLVATATSHYFNMAVSQGMVNEESTRLMDVIRKMTGDPVTQQGEEVESVCSSMMTSALAVKAA